MPKFSLAAMLAMLAAAPAFAATYEINPKHTQVQFTWNHFGFSNPVGLFGGVTGKLVFDPDDPTRSSVEASIPVKTVNTNVEVLDKHLRSADYLDAAKFPRITFKSTRVARGATPDKLIVTGDLTLHGVTRPVTLDVTVNKVGDYPTRKVVAAGFDATAVIKRSEFGIARFVPKISDDIRIRITTETFPEGASKLPETGIPPRKS